ncbi:MAG: peptidylprolyl isomerase [Candidatus Sumerlaeota bacterium]
MKSLKIHRILSILIFLVLSSGIVASSLVAAQDIEDHRYTIDLERKPGEPLPTPPPIKGKLPEIKKKDKPEIKATPKPTPTPELGLYEMYPPHQVIVGEVGNSSEYLLTRLELDRMVDASMGEFDEDDLLKRGLHEAVRRNLMQERENERLEILRKWAIMKSIALQARREGSRVSDKEIDEYLKTLQREFGDEAFDAERSPVIKMVGISREQLRSELKDSLLVEQFVSKRIQQHFTEDELKALWRRNRSAYTKPAQIRAWQIFRSVPQSATKDEKKEWRKDFVDVWKKARKADDIKDFQKLAAKYSDPPYHEKSGSMGWVSLNADLHEDLRAALFRLDVGEISRIVETPVGWHILTVSEKRPAKGVTFDDYARELVKQLLIQEFKDTFGYDLMRKADFTVRFNTTGLRLVGQDYKKD